MQIIDTDAFLDMPATSQLLYFHLVMRADDEGFVSNPKKISRLVGVHDDDLKVLVAKRFILSFKSGIVVIKHWLIHNTIRMDRFGKTVYEEERGLLKVKNNKAYSELATNRQPDAVKSPLKLSKVKLSKVKLSKVKLSKVNLRAPHADKTNIILDKFHKTINPGINFGNKTNRSACEWLIKKYGEEKVLAMIDFSVGVFGKPYAPVITTPYQLKTKLSQLLAYIKRENEINKKNMFGDKEMKRIADSLGVEMKK